MNKKRIMISVALVLVLALSMALLVACGGGKEVGDITAGDVNAKDYYPANFTAVDYSNAEEFEEVAGKDAFELLKEVVNTWRNDKGYKRTQYFSFAAETPGKPSTQFAKDVYKIDGDKIYRELVTIQDSEPYKDNKNEVTRFYWDGTKAQRVVLNDAKEKTIVPGDPDNEGGLFYVSKLPAMAEYAEDSSAMRTKYTTHLTTYIWDKKENLVDDGFKVYKAKDGTLRFTITLDVKGKEKMYAAHEKAAKEIESSTGGKAGTLEMKENTTIDFVVKEIGGVNKIVSWRRTEQYQGKAGGVIPIPAKQTSLETFSYDEADYKITDTDIA